MSQLLRSADQETFAAVKCRFGCEAPIGIYHVPAGCVCWPDPVQALCEQHVVTAESIGPVRLLVDLRISKNDLPLIDEALHSLEIIESLQHRSMQI